MSKPSNVSHNGKLDPIKTVIKPLKPVYYYLTPIHYNVPPIQATVRRELAENAGVEGPDSGTTQAGGHSEENQRGCR